MLLIFANSFLFLLFMSDLDSSELFSISDPNPTCPSQREQQVIVVSCDFYERFNFVYSFVKTFET